MIYVVSDIHGREDRFNSILNQIHLKSSDHLYILGDVIDRNSGGLRLLNRIYHAKNITLLLGNHEHMMMESLDHPDDWRKRSLWRAHNGGDITWEKWKYCTNEFKEKMREYLHSLPINIDISCAGKNWLLVHGSPEVMYGSGENSKYTDSRTYAVWNRLTAYDELPDGKIVIFGHTPTEHYQHGHPMTVFIGDKRIGIDCGCAYPHGRLACLRLDDGAVFYSEDDMKTDGSGVMWFT